MDFLTGLANAILVFPLRAIAWIVWEVPDGWGLPLVMALLFLAVVGAAHFWASLVYQRGLLAHVISVLSSAVRQVLPLPEALFLEAGKGRDRRSTILRRIAEGLVAGLPLGLALRTAWPRCPGREVAFLQVAEAANQLPQALEAMEADSAQRQKDDLGFRPGLLLYPLVLLGAMASLGTALMLYVVPKLKDILAGSNTPPTFLTAQGWEVADWYTHGGSATVLLAALAAGGTWLYSRFRARRPERPRLLSNLGDFVKWHLPVWRWFERNASLVQTVEALRLSLRAGATIDTAVARAAEMDTNLCYRKRLRKWLALIRRGEDVSETAARCGVGKGLAWAIDTRVNPSGSLDALEMIERLYRANYSYAVSTARMFFWPWVTIALGLLVAMVAMAVLGPMFALIQANTSSVIPR